NAANTVVFQAAPGNSKMPELSYAAIGSADNYVIRFENTSWVTFKGMKIEATGAQYGLVVDLSPAYNDHITFEEDSIVTKQYASSGDFSGIQAFSGPNDHIAIKKNTILGGYRGISFLSSDSTSKGLLVDSN